MAKSNKMEYYNKASFGFYIHFREKEKVKRGEKKSRLSKETLVIASDIGNYLSFKNSSYQKAYLGTLVEFGSAIPLDTITKAVKELTRENYMYQDDDLSLYLCDEFFEFKTQIEMQHQEKTKSSKLNHNEVVIAVLNDIRNLYLGNFSIEDFWNLIKHQITSKNKVYSNFYNGAYKHILIELFINHSLYYHKGFLEYDREQFHTWKVAILSIYFPSEVNTKIRSQDYLLAEKHIDFFIKMYIRDLTMETIETWKHKLSRGLQVKYKCKNNDEIVITSDDLKQLEESLKYL